MTSADDLIRLLGLMPHPEGGHYRETFRDPARGADDRAASTAIYFLLRAGEVSRWHRVRDAEVWHWYAGAPLVLSIAGPDGQSREHHLGPDVAGGERPQIVVPASHWQQAASTGAYSLVGCTVAPGFEFSRFEMAPGGWTPLGRP